MAQVRAVISRERILDAAAEAFDRAGYIATSVAEISASIGKEKGFIAHHFRTKSALALALVEELEQKRPSLVKAARDRADSGLGAVIVVSTELARMFRDDVRVRAAVRLHREAGVIDADLPYPYQEWISLVDTLLAVSDNGGELLPGVDLTGAARLIVGGFLGIEQIVNDTGQRADMLEWTRGMWTALLPGLVPADSLDRFLALTIEVPEG
ncbi:DNA-binding transcriptional regulator, AcrR family [Microbacterium azadirachtae]|uniref:DNA-binding transcriptional regulator, AcrR family n=1 Tax=Microbacterium azadirachtae TaxID=582680 RepID=A0A1I6FZW5_9MICO|nr:ScbR family autoregulator-binding transcription factor [Microbacterium azadirachtae]SFR35462.1 DNA-binding transcriptional regulator, AcrR family [Microbacterium azadirachtae]